MQPISSAVLATVAYADIFDYPLTAPEIHRYLVGVSAPLSAVQEQLHTNPFIKQHLQQHGRYYMLTGRDQLPAIRQERETLSQSLWARAYHYGRIIAQLPFIRMVAVTGSLAVNNVTPDADIDYFIITADDRLWLTRAMVILIVRWAATHHITLCPNYFLAKRAIELDTQTLYAAREITQMVPLVGRAVYQQFRAANAWTADHLPNAIGPPPLLGRVYERQKRPLLEHTLRTPFGQALENWEQHRKIPRFQAQQHTTQNQESAFSADWCKGHFNQHLTRVMTLYTTNLDQLNQNNLT